jgi:Lrp/AsnC family transcriptional regulator, leucine-responsive regulatory protein
MDAVDYQIIEFLSKDGRMPFAQIAAQIGKSTATVHQRVRRLRERGYINSFTVDLNWEALGYPVDAFVSIRDNESQGLESLAASLRKLPFVISASAVTGEFDLLLHIKARSSSHLGKILDEIRRIGPGPSRTLVTLSTYISGRIPPLPADEPPTGSF